MSRQYRLGLVAAAVAVVVAVIVIVQVTGDDASPETVATPSPATTAATSGTEPEAQETGTQAPPSKPQTISIVVRNGRVRGGLVHATLAQGQRAVILVRADVEDEVHLHGYDVMRDVAPGAPARIAVRANLPGRFEIELEDRKLQIGELEVRP